MYPEHYGTHEFFPRSSDFEVVRLDDFQGLGVRSLRQFRPGDLVAEFTGELVLERTQHSLQVDSNLHLEDLYFVGYFLHSCAPNVTVDMTRRLVHAADWIEPEQFLRMDYAETEDMLYKQFPCRCGAPQCRRWITGRREAPNMSQPILSETSAHQDQVA